MKKEGTVYFIQPTELINTNKYKIGMSRENDLCRLKKYHKGTRFICVMSCKYPVTLESILKTCFKSKYKLIAGSEYFEGNQDEMLEDFLEIIKENKNDNLKDKEIEIDNEKTNNVEINKEENINIIDDNIEIKLIDTDDTNKKMKSCKICDKSYKSYNSLWNHNKNFHTKKKEINKPKEINKNIIITDEKYTCVYCDKPFSTRQNKWKHQKLVCKDKNKKSEIEELKEKVNTQINLHDNLIKIIEKLANSNIN